MNIRKKRAPRRVINRDSQINKTDSSASGKKSSAGSGFYYSFLTVILLLCLIQITVSAVLNVSKVISYKAKIVQITKTRDSALAMNEQLKDSIKNFSNVASLEAIARNNLKMSSADEVMVIINTPKDEKEDPPKKHNFWDNFKLN